MFNLRFSATGRMAAASTQRSQLGSSVDLVCAATAGPGAGERIVSFGQRLVELSQSTSTLLKRKTMDNSKGGESVDGPASAAKRGQPTSGMAKNLSAAVASLAPEIGDPGIYADAPVLVNEDLLDDCAADEAQGSPLPASFFQDVFGASLSLSKLTGGAPLVGSSGAGPKESESSAFVAPLSSIGKLPMDVSWLGSLKTIKPVVAARLDTEPIASPAVSGGNSPDPFADGVPLGGGYATAGGEGGPACYPSQNQGTFGSGLGHGPSGSGELNARDRSGLLLFRQAGLHTSRA